MRTNVAFDNFDRFVETSSGKNTLHDTVGIVYQNVQRGPHSTHQVIDAHDTIEEIVDVPSAVRRRRYISNFDSHIEPYCKGHPTFSCLFAEEPVIPESLQNSCNMNNVWMLNYALEVDSKRWFAFHSERVKDTNPIQKIGYLPNLNMSPTSDSVVKKTLEIAQKIAEECDQKNIIVIYDLAIAAKAYKIQSDLSPKFDNLFINLGAFHTEISFFKVNLFMCIR